MSLRPPNVANSGPPTSLIRCKQGSIGIVCSCHDKLEATVRGEVERIAKHMSSGDDLPDESRMTRFYRAGSSGPLNCRFPTLDMGHMHGELCTR